MGSCPSWRFSGNWLLGRINLRLIPIAMSRYACKFNACPCNPIRVSRYNTLRNRSDDHSCPLASGPQTHASRLRLALAPAASIVCDYCTRNRCSNGMANYKYHTTNSPTSRGTYRWMTLASLDA